MLVVLGHTNIDVQLAVQRLPERDQSSPAQDRRTVYGGTACNIARHAAGLGVPVRLWSRVGGDFPPDWKIALEDDGVDLSFLDIEASGRTPTCYVLTDADGHQAYVMDQGAMGHAIEHPPAADILTDARWLHVGTGLPAAYQDLATLARKRGIEVAFDPGQEIHFAYDASAFETLLDSADTAFFNQAELDAALRFMKYGDPVQLLDHVDRVITTHGAAGARLYEGRHIHEVPAPDVDAVDPTGAGDALRAGWYAALHAGKDRKEALAWGVAAGSAAVTFPGPQGRTLGPDDLTQVRGA